MQKLIMTLIVCIITFGQIEAQQSFGIKGGLNISNLAVDKDHIKDTNAKNGWTVGLINRSNAGLLTVQTELLWSRKGAKYMVGATDVDANLDYLELPLTLNIRLFNSPLLVYGGGYAAYLLNAKYEYNDSQGNVFATYDERDAFHKWDFGLAAGASLQLQNLLLDARITRGLSNVESESITTPAQTFLANDTKNFNIQFTAGFLF
ncbi:MAG: porin family protein [Saprospiraceae bacterium]